MYSAVIYNDVDMVICVAFMPGLRASLEHVTTVLLA